MLINGAHAVRGRGDKALDRPAIELHANDGISAKRQATRGIQVMGAREFNATSAALVRTRLNRRH